MGTRWGCQTGWHGVACLILWELGLGAGAPTHGRCTRVGSSCSPLATPAPAFLADSVSSAAERLRSSASDSNSPAAAAVRARLSPTLLAIEAIDLPSGASENRRCGRPARSADDTSSSSASWSGPTGQLPSLSAAMRRCRWRGATTPLACRHCAPAADRCLRHRRLCFACPLPARPRNYLSDKGTPFAPPLARLYRPGRKSSLRSARSEHRGRRCAVSERSPKSPNVGSPKEVRKATAR